jgi:HlyD family secretion protein
MIRILLVDDQNIVREEIQALLETKPKLQIVGTAEDGKSAIEQVEKLKPDLVLMDLEMPKLNGIDATKKICQQFPQTKVLVLSHHKEPKYILQALQAGAEGYLLKDTVAKDLERAIWSVYHGQSQIDTKLIKEILTGTDLRQPLRSAEQEGASSTRKQRQTASLNLQKNSNLANFNNPHDTVESISSNHQHQLSSKIDRTDSLKQSSPSEITTPADNHQTYENQKQTKLNLLSQPKNRWLIALVSLGLLVAGATIIYGLNFTNRPTTTTEETIEPIFEAVTALGRIEPEGEVITLSPPPNMGGTRIGELMVEEGEQVKVQQVIALLDNHAFKKAAVEAAQQEVELAQVNLAIVKAGAKTGDIEAQKAVISRLKAELAGKIKTQKATIARLEAQLSRETESQLANWRLWQAELENATADFQRYQKLAQDGAISISELDSRRLTLETAKQRVREAQANYYRTRDTLQEAIKEARATREETQNTIAQQIQEANASLASISEVRPLDVQKAQAELARAIAKLKETQQDLELTYVKAPISGQILSINAYPGEMVNQEEGVVELGQTDRMVVIAEIYESDIKRVKLGQQATIVSEGGAFTDEIQGKVTHIRPQIRKKDVLDTDPAADVDTRIVEVKIRLNPTSSKKVVQLTNSKVVVKINSN